MIHGARSTTSVHENVYVGECRGAKRPIYSGAHEPVYECDPGRNRGTSECGLRRKVKSTRRNISLAKRPSLAAQESDDGRCVWCCCGVDVHRESVTACVLRRTWAKNPPSCSATVLWSSPITCV